MNPTTYTILGYVIALTLLLGYAVSLWVESITARKAAQRIAARERKVRGGEKEHAS